MRKRQGASGYTTNMANAKALPGMLYQAHVNRSPAPCQVVVENTTNPRHPQVLLVGIATNVFCRLSEDVKHRAVIQSERYNSIDSNKLPKPLMPGGGAGCEALCRHPVRTVQQN